MSGDIKFTWHGPRIATAFKEGSVEGLTMATEHLLKVSRDQVPLEEGNLERSGRADVDAASMRGSVSYGSGVSADYAVIQHERLDLHHDSGRNAKYLENAVNSEQQTMAALIAGALRRRVS